MAQDIREMFKDDLSIPDEGLKRGHEARFNARLDAHFGKEAKAKAEGYLWMKIAAVLVVLIAISGLLLNNPLSTGTQAEQTVEANSLATTQPVKVQLSDFSPEYKQIEDSYLATIHMELAQLNVTDDNKAIVDAYMGQLEELNQEYDRLNADLVETGVNDYNIQSLIDNLQFRLDLLNKLKEKLNELQVSQNNEIQTNTL
ncbi:MAG TPA: hypothetical protein DIV44_15400 [Leeuwenhoekiella sp.]|nr:hypothetical protein [Leeuwenhoekiella sp.]HAX16740.1 hypothetical protein [Leeuwenhoekiella sp.]HBO28767.1 hypothetical protein [Leeuwenhoekiella sp.]HCQ78195.1 hypothetical protein [Leeuwenhoekiella sp.]|tara:strand:+ start:1416 stop:2015 length:600 start_codon:yes stop_codon:yes gene_type:complete